MADFWQQVITLNDYQMERFVQRILKGMFDSVVNKKIAVFGFAFKPDTGDTRDAPAIHICKRLLQEKARLCITDPHALPNAKLDLKDVDGTVEYAPDPYTAAENAHAIVLITEWDVFKTLDYQKIYDRMEKPAFLFDGRNCLDHQALFEIGFNVYAIGRLANEKFSSLGISTRVGLKLVGVGRVAEGAEIHRSVRHDWGALGVNDMTSHAFAYRVGGHMEGVVAQIGR